MKWCLLAAVLGTACASPPEPQPPEREACWLLAAGAFHAAAEQCETAVCIDALAFEYRQQQEQCP